MSARFRIASWAAAPLLLASAAAIAGDAPRPALPPFAGAYEPRSVDERGVWMIADEDERALRDSSFVIRDAALTGYVHGVLCRTVGAERCAATRVYVMRVAAMNATTAPNGCVMVWSGLLLRARNEAELAAVLGHEFAHFELRHTLASYRHQRSMSDIAMWASLAAGSTGGAVGSAAAGLQSAAVGSIFSFNRDEERQADVLGERYLIAAGYDANAFPALWGRVMDEADATAFGRRQRSHRYDRVAFFASHPTDLEREGYLRSLAATARNPGDDAAASYAAAMKPWRAEFLADQLKLNDFGGTEYLLEQLAIGGWTEDLLFARGELYRSRGNPRDLSSAADFYRQAIALDPAHAASYRGLGMSLLRNGDGAGGRAALKQYLTLDPSAPDAPMIATVVTS